MHALDARDILGLWERCPSLHPIDRTLAILRAGTEVAWGELAALPIGERERLAAALRIHTFGPRADGAEACPACGVLHELELPLTEVVGAPAATAAPFSAAVDDLTLTLRVPDSRDQAAIVGCADEASAVRHLLARCVVDAQRDGQPVDVAQWSDELIAAVAALLEARDGNADARIAMRCVDCAHEWEVCFDVGEYLWLEVRARARRLLYEVGVLAGAFHWSEDAILAMSARRRTAYLEMVGV